MYFDQLFPDSQSRHLQAFKNELEVLKVVRDFGYARRTEIQRAVWPKSDEGVAKKMALRTVSRLLQKQYLLKRPTLRGGHCLILTKPGADYLSTWGVEADAGYDLHPERAQFVHRTIGTRYLIEKAILGHETYAEHAINQGYGPLSRDALIGRFAKIPDGLITVPSTERGGEDESKLCVDWIEVENANKPPDELEKVFDVAWRTGQWLDESKHMQLDRLIFVFDVARNHETAIKAALRRYAKENPIPDEKFFSSIISSIILARCTIGHPALKWHRYEEVSCKQELPALLLQQRQLLSESLAAPL